ncbi:hypothetical protein [Streptomyces sp. NBC_01483]|uniref:hypothetical protein n=1 Tax=Streptomyces sp. NBC_01483 TaxID=2903883 RepID=UPI002E2F0795|nr:hypothetical protein [Streptomyces sp. NBC_01483]
MLRQLKLTRDGDALVARLAPSQASAMYEALTYLRAPNAGDEELTLLVGAGREAVDAVVERLAGSHTESFDIRLRWEELHMVHSALTTAPTMFLTRGVFTEEPFHIQLGFYRENFDALALAIVNAAAQV